MNDRIECGDNKQTRTDIGDKKDKYCFGIDVGGTTVKCGLFDC